VPFYDGSIAANKKKLLGEVKLHPLVAAKVEAFKLVTLSDENNRRQSVRTKDQSENQLIKYSVKKDSPSLILSDFQISNLAQKIPSIYRNLQWRLLYRMSTHGVSMNTFIERVKEEEVTLTILEDSLGYKFGGFTFDEWRHRKGFFGSGETFVYTFKD
jgi:hypothetical protein